MKPTLFDTINEILPAHPDGSQFMEDIARRIEAAVIDWHKVIVLDKLDFDFYQAFATPSRQHLYINVIGRADTYTIRLVQNNLILSTNTIPRP